MAALILLVCSVPSGAVGVETFSLGGQVWLDLDDDGQQGVFEPAIPLVALTLTGGSGEPIVGIAPVSTTAEGEYRFDGLPAGSYRVQVLATAFQAGGALARRTSSTRTNPLADADADHDDNGIDTSDPAALGVWSSPVTLGLGGPEPVGDIEGLLGAGPSGDDHSNLTLDFGFIAPFAIGNRVWRDLDNDGRLTAADGANPGIEGVRLTLTDVAGAALPGISPTVTDAHGYYRFDRVGRGQFVVTVDSPNFAPRGPLDGMISSEATQTNAESDIDGDDNGLDAVDPASDGVRSPWIALSLSGEPLLDLGGQASHGIGDDDRSNLTVDFGFYPLSSIGDLVWNDRDRDGRQDGDEPGVGGVTLTLSAGGVALATTTSANDGSYRFTGLRHGASYSLKAIVPDGYAFGPNDVGTDDRDSDLDPASGRAPVAALAAGTSDTTVDIGLWKPSAIGDRVWADLDGDGRQDPDEPGRAGVQVELVRDGVTLGETRSDGAGRYRFDGLSPGSGYRVRFHPPVGEVLSPAGRSSTELDSTADPLTLETPTFALASEQRDLSIDVGVFEPATLVALAFVDANANGRADGGERGVSGVSVTVRQDAIAVTSQATEALGHLRIARLAAGVVYRIDIVPPAGYAARGATAREEMLPASGSADVFLIPLTLSKRETSTATVGALSVRQRWPATIRRGSTVSVQIEVRNGPTVARDARLVVLFSASLRPLERSGAWRVAGRRAEIRLGQIMPGGRRRVRIRVRVGPAAARSQRSLVRASASGGSSATTFAELRVAVDGRVR